MAASTLRTSQSYLGAKFRRLRSRLGPPKAITAMARTLAILFYRMLKFGQDYVDRGIEFYEQRQRDQQLQYLQKRLLNSAFEPLHYRRLHRSFWRVQRDSGFEPRISD
jgi:transposase